MTDKTKVPERRWLYCPECPAGQIFEGAEIKAALSDGWENTPPSDDAMKTAEIDAAAEAEETEIARLEKEVAGLQTKVEKLEELDAAALTEKVHELEGQNATVRGELKIEIAAHKKTQTALTKATKAAAK